MAANQSLWMETYGLAVVGCCMYVRGYNIQKEGKKNEEEKQEEKEKSFEAHRSKKKNCPMKNS